LSNEKRGTGQKKCLWGYGPEKPPGVPIEVTRNQVILKEEISIGGALPFAKKNFRGFEQSNTSEKRWRKNKKKR